jgi:uncharacterized sulfatase
MFTDRDHLQAQGHSPADSEELRRLDTALGGSYLTQRFNEADGSYEYYDSRRQKRIRVVMIPSEKAIEEDLELFKRQQERWKDYVAPGDLAAFRGTGDWETNYPDYLGCCHALDANVGRIRALLERLGAWEDTVVIYTADHGSHFRTRNGEYKRSPHDASVHIPMILRGPGFRGGRVETAIASLIDLPRTVLAAAGLTAPRAMAGRDLATGGSDAAFVQISESLCGRAIRETGWTYAVKAADVDGGTPTSPSGSWVETELYDNRADPHQLRNLVGDATFAAERARLRERLIAWMRDSGDAVASVAAP